MGTLYLQYLQDKDLVFHYLATQAVILLVSVISKGLKAATPQWGAVQSLASVIQLLWAVTICF